MNEPQFTDIATHGASMTSLPGLITAGLYLISLIFLSKAYSEVFKLYFPKDKFFKTKLIFLLVICPLMVVGLMLLMTNFSKSDNFLLHYASIITLYSTPLLVAFIANKPKTPPADFKIKKAAFLCIFGGILFSLPVIYEHLTPPVGTASVATLYKVTVKH